MGRLCVPVYVGGGVNLRGIIHRSSEVFICVCYHYGLSVVLLIGILNVEHSDCQVIVINKSPIYY